MGFQFDGPFVVSELVGERLSWQESGELVAFCFDYDNGLVIISVKSTNKRRIWV